MKEEDRKRIDEILGEMTCPKEFQCAESGFEELCRAKDFGDEQRLHCLEPESVDCPFSTEYDCGFRMRFCSCPLRVYIAKNLGK